MQTKETFPHTDEAAERRVTGACCPPDSNPRLWSEAGRLNKSFSDEPEHREAPSYHMEFGGAAFHK